MRRIGSAVAALVLAAAGLGTATATAVAVPTAAVNAADCPTGWGSGDKGAVSVGAVPLSAVRAGRHACFDRLVFDVPGGGTVGYLVGYVDQLHQVGSGRHIPVGGGAVLEVRVAAPSYAPETGAPVYPGQVARPLPGVDVSGYDTFRDTRFGGSFEGETQIGLGVRARLPFRVIQLPDRLVVDVARSWTGSA